MALLVNASNRDRERKNRERERLKAKADASVGGAASLPDGNAPWDTFHLIVVCCLNSPLHFSRPTFSKCASSSRLGRATVSVTGTSGHWAEEKPVHLNYSYLSLYFLYNEKKIYRNANPFGKYFALAVVILIANSSLVVNITSCALSVWVQTKITLSQFEFD